MATPTTFLDEPVLVLNRGYAATRVVPVRQAFVLLFRDAAEVISVVDGRWEQFNLSSWLEVAEFQRQFEAESYEWVRTASSYVAVPRIIRVRCTRMPEHHVRLNRRNLYARDRNICQYCGQRFPRSELSIDHIMPQSRGGENSWTNLVCACVRCNARKGNKTPSEARMHLIKPPRRPRTCPDRSIRLRRRHYEAWKVFLNEAYWTVELRD